MTALVLRCTENWQNTERVIAMDSAFCVTHALVELRKVGLLACTIAKKKKYWPKDVPGDAIVMHIKGKPIGKICTNQIEVEKCNIRVFAVQHTKHPFVLLATYGTSCLVGPVRRAKDTDGSVIRFRRNQPIDDYYTARHAVDDHNRARQGTGHDFEKKWNSRSWDIRQLAFLISSSIVNAHLARRRFDRQAPDQSLLVFKRELALQLLNLDSKDSAEPGNVASRTRHQTAARNTPKQSIHHLESMPPHTGARGNYVNTAYPQWRCRGYAGRKCQRKVRTFCACMSGMWMCKSCHPWHVVEVRDGQGSDI